MSDALVIRNGFVVDGSGAPGSHADVVVEDGRIAAVVAPGTAPTAGAGRVFDADGRLVTPGWVDVHTHYDAQVSWDPWMTPSSWHGVTTVVMGNCGVGFAPADPARHEWLIELMEGVEDIPGSAMTEGITWEWESFPEYLDAIEAHPHVLDIGTQIAHGPLRAYVMGERGAANEPATAAEVAAMSVLVEEALRAGALGFSTSRTPLHRSKSGELVPGTDADADELWGIGEALARVGHGVFQFAPEHSRLPTDEWPWMRELARRTRRPVCVNLNQPDQAPDVWRRVLGLLDEAAAEGLGLYAPVCHVPLVVRWPGTFDGGRVEDDVVRLEDVAPTLLDLCGLPPLDDIDGRSLSRDLPGRVARAMQPASDWCALEAERRYPGPGAMRLSRGAEAVFDGRRRLIAHSDGTFELYDPRSDPQESQDLAAVEPAEVRRLRALLQPPR